MHLKFSLFLIVVSIQLKAQSLDNELRSLSDAPNDTAFEKSNELSPNSYEEALIEWLSVEDVNGWVEQNFRYSFDRAKQLAENSSDKSKTSIYTPEELYQIRKGVCIDLSRFMVETINKIDTSKTAQYLMIEFEPITIDGSIIRKHWIAAYQDKGGYYLIGDSKRPGYKAGPYKKMDDFIAEYQTYRGREIVSWRILATYKKVMKRKKIKQQRG